VASPGVIDHTETALAYETAKQQAQRKHGPLRGSTAAC
jgi:hypothetical protein